MKKVKSFFREFKEFVSRGNVLDLAVAVIIGGAFGKIVTSLVNDVIMPLVTSAIGVHSLAELSIVLRDAVVDADGTVIKAALVLKWGNFFQNIVDFLIIAFVVFLIIKTLMAVKNVAGKVTTEAKEAIEKTTELIKSRLDGEETKAEQEISSSSTQSDAEGKEVEATAVIERAAVIESAAEPNATEIAGKASTAQGELQSIEKLLVDIKELLSKKE